MSLAKKAYHDYKVYMALKLHFDPDNDYDYHRYNGVFRVKEETFRKRKDAPKFLGFSKKIKNRDPKDVLLAYALQHYKIDWIGKVNSFSELLDNADNYTILRANIYEHLGDYCRALFTLGDSPFDCFVPDGRDSFPRIVNEVIAGRLPVHVYSVLNKALPFHHKLQVDDPIVFEDFDYIVRAYDGFVDVDTERCKTIIREVLENLES